MPSVIALFISTTPHLKTVSHLVGKALLHHLRPAYLPPPPTLAYNILCMAGLGGKESHTFTVKLSRLSIPPRSELSELHYKAGL
jgi:hypothetical protein